MRDEESEAFDPADDCQWRPVRELLRRQGFEPAPAAALDDFQLRGRLWELIYALAGQRIYLAHTDHISDRRLYTWLEDEWLDEEIPDVPPETDWSYDLDASDFGNGLDPIIWLQYFASEEERAAFAAEHNLEMIPVHKDPPFDRDRWLPEPTGSISLDEFADEELFPLGEELEDDGAEVEDDPLGLAAADAAIRAEQQREELSALAGCEETEAWQRPIDQLNRDGESLLPPDELTDETITAKLWELLHSLACRGFFLIHTDHLSDRELYAELWQRGLRDDALLPGKAKTGGWYHDFIGSGSDDHNQIWLRYYASAEQRAEWSRDWPGCFIPPQEKPPFNRDWRLPQGPF